MKVIHNQSPKTVVFVFWYNIVVTEIQDNETRVMQQIESANANSIEELEAILEENEHNFHKLQREHVRKCPGEIDSNGIKFHKQHYLILIVKWLLINMYGRRPGILNNQLSEQRLQNKLRWSKDYLKAINIIDAGISHNRGKTNNLDRYLISL